MSPRSITLLSLGLALVPGLSAGQDFNFILPVDSIERRLEVGPLSFRRIRDTRFEGDRTQRVDLQFPDSSVMSVKWAAAPVGGHAFNNAPRYERASYALQALFLSPDQFVVPPTVLRVVPLPTAQTVRSSVRPTFRGSSGVLVVLQYWLPNVTGGEVWFPRRADLDPTYARNIANLNLFTFLARHSDSNQGNFLISTDATNPRVFAVDNGLSFGSEESDRGTFWRDLRVDRVPAETVARLRAITRADLDRALGVLAEWVVTADGLVPATPGPNLNPRTGVRRSGERVQVGLTASEIAGIHRRLETVLRRVDSGRLGVF